jgi:predicted TIM-barrel fold metal-dependent hydrolase
MTDAMSQREDRGRVDVHAHFVPDFYKDALIAAGQSRPDGFPTIPSWSPDAALGLMDKLGVRTAILSISSPGVHFGDDTDARHLSRRVNDEGARHKREHPGRFGHLASVPLPDIEGAVAETARALDELKADGIIIETNHNGMYLGDSRLDPFWTALEARRAVVLVHPTSPACICSERLDAIFPRPALEFMFETTRSITDLVIAGVHKRFPSIRIIVPHAGAALPVLAQRVDLAMPIFAGPGAPPPPSLKDAMKSLHFDLAGAPVPQLLRALLDLADPQHIHYGSDFPFTPAPACERLLQALEATPLLKDRAFVGVWGDNARRLFPHLDQAAEAVAIDV